MSNPNYLNEAAFAVAQSIKTDWRHILGKSSPVLAMVFGNEGGGNFNRSSNVSGNGTFTVPVIFDNTGVEFTGVTTANQLTPMVRTMMSGHTQAEYRIAHYRGLYHITAEDRKFLSGPAGTYRGDKLKAIKKQVADKIEKVLAPLTLGTQADSQTNHLGLLRVTALANTVGGINQAATAAWQSNVDAAGGVITLDRIDLMVDAAEQRGNIDILVASSGNGGPNIYQSILAQIRGKEFITNNNGKLAQFGFKSAEYSGIPVTRDRYFPAAATGFVLGLSSNSLFARGTEKPEFMAPNPVDGTDGHEVVFTHFFGLGTNDCASHFLISGLTG